MKLFRTITLCVALISGASHTVFGQGTSFTYQGRLSSSSGPVSGLRDVKFTLFSVASGGSAVAGPLTISAVPVSNGLFTATLDFGSAVFNGSSYWLELGVVTNGGVVFDTLAPRQLVTPSPYAVFAAKANSVAATNITGLLPDGQLSSNVALRSAINTFVGSSNLFTGNVGIGTTSPAKTLEVSANVGPVSPGGSVESSVIVRVSNPAATGNFTSPNVAGIGFGRNSTRQAIVGGTFGNDYLDFFTAGLLTSPQMRIDANGNVGIGTNAPAQRLHVIGNIVSSGTVTANGVLLTSDRNAKENFRPVDNQAVLAKVATLPLSEWSYKTESASVMHMGPMAQDFQAAFQLGSDDKHISVVDAGGVALAAIQGLNQKVESQRTQLEQRDAEIVELKSALKDLQEFVHSLDRKLNNSAH